jgi:hypothetical protein
MLLLTEKLWWQIRLSIVFMRWYNVESRFSILDQCLASSEREMNFNDFYKSMR